MILPSLFFWVFAVVLLAAAALVVGSRNPVHSVLFLILAFFNAAGLFVLLGAEFLAMILVVVYVGAVAVLFLFVVMMLDVDFVELRSGFLDYLPIGGFVAVILLIELIAVGTGWVLAPEVAASLPDPSPPLDAVSNTAAIGQLLYTRYVFFFQVAGLVLLVAMIGAIVLTIRHRKDVKRQNVVDQMHRDPKAAIKMVDVKPGQGL